MPQHAALLFVAALLAGALNAVAGGGGFIAFPALLFAGILPIQANATNTIALWPGTVASTAAYRGELKGSRHWRAMLPLFIVSLIGALVGARLLLRTPQATFFHMIPWLLLAATLLFAFGGMAVKSRGNSGLQDGAAPDQKTRMKIAVILLQLLVAAYIGFFGAGAGILMLALFTIMGLEHIHTMNAFKTTMASCANGVAVVTFIVARVVAWPQALLMIIGAVIGGYGGAWYAQRVNPKFIRGLVIAIGSGMSAYFFWDVYR